MEKFYTIHMMIWSSMELAIGFVLGLLIGVALMAILKVASDDDERNGRG